MSKNCDDRLDRIESALGRIATVCDDSNWFIIGLQDQINEVRDDELKEILSTMHRNQLELVEKLRSIFVATQRFPRPPKGDVLEEVAVLRNDAVRRLDRNLAEKSRLDLDYFVVSQKVITHAHKERQNDRTLTNEEILVSLREGLQHTGGKPNEEQD